MDPPAGNTNVWVVPDVRAATGLFDLNNYAAYAVSINNDLGNNFTVDEDDAGVFAQLEFNAELGAIPVRGNVGVRYVETDQTTTGWARAPAARICSRSITNMKTRCRR